MTLPLAILATPRLIARAITPADFADIYSDLKLMKTLSADGKPLSGEKTREQIRQAVEHWQTHGFGFWVFHRRSDGQLIGRGGLKVYQIDGKDVVGLGYAVMPDHWNQGFATEMAHASLDVGFRQLEFPEICSWTLPTNLASRRVTEKLGFQYEKDFEFAGLRHRFYRMAAREWRGYDGVAVDIVSGEMP
jgi:[ribosomal protein S5]-alanine N-acetyltransferase